MKDQCGEHRAMIISKHLIKTNRDYVVNIFNHSGAAIGGRVGLF